MSGVTYTSQRMAAMPAAARAHVSVQACVPVSADLPGRALGNERPWDLGITPGFTAKQHPRHLGSSST